MVREGEVSDNNIKKNYAIVLITLMFTLSLYGFINSNGVKYYSEERVNSEVILDIQETNDDQDHLQIHLV